MDIIPEPFQFSRIVHAVIRVALVVFSISVTDMRLCAQLDPQNPTKEYIRLGGRVIAIENAEAAPPGSVTLEPTNLNWQYNETTPKHVSVTVNGTVNWSPPTVSCPLPPCNWITVSNLTSSGFDVSVAANPNPSPRVGSVNAANAKVDVFQTGMPGMGSLNPSSVNASPAGETVAINISADPGFAWTAASDRPWIVITSATSGTGNGSLTVRIDPNPNPTETRNGKVTVSGLECTITQSASSIYIDPSFVDWVFAAGYRQFHAYVDDVQRDGAFQWSVIGLGTISQSGLYQAPMIVSQDRQDVIVIRDPATGQEAARATVQLRVNPYGAAIYNYSPSAGLGGVGAGQVFMLVPPSVMESIPPLYVDIAFTKNPLGADSTPTSLANSCHVRIVKTTTFSLLALADDSGGGINVASGGDFWWRAVAFPFSSGTQENSQCKVVAADVTSLHGNPYQGWTWFFYITIQFKPTFAGHLTTVARHSWTYTEPIPWSNWNILGSWDAIGYESPTVKLEAPATGTALPPGIAGVSGYALDNEDYRDTPITQVEVSIDGKSRALASYGQPRTDVCGLYFNNRPNCPNVGFIYSWDTTTVSNGVHTIRVTATDSDPTPHSASADVSVTVNNPVPESADVVIAVGHDGSFTQGQGGAQYLLIVTNRGAQATSGAVTVVDALPTGLVATSMAGSGWACNTATLTCTRVDSLAPSSSYPPITLTVNVSLTAPSSVTNTASVSLAGETNTANNTSSDLTSITTLPAGLTLTNLTITSGVSVYQNPTSVTASGVTISGTADVSFKAGVFIRLAPEFRATAGSAATTFRASIE